MAFERSSWRFPLTTRSSPGLSRFGSKMATMNLGLQHDPDLEPKRAKTLFISICIHIAIFAFLILNPDLLVQAPRRIVRIAGQDYDLSKNQMTELVMPPQAKPKPPSDSKPMVQPPQPQQPPPQAA